MAAADRLCDLDRLAMDALNDLILRDRTFREVGPTVVVLVAYCLACLGVGARFYPLAE